MALEEHPDAYIAVSTAENVELIFGENIAATIAMLKESPNGNTWVRVTKELEEMHKQYG